MAAKLLSSCALIHGQWQVIQLSVMLKTEQNDLFLAVADKTRAAGLFQEAALAAV